MLQDRRFHVVLLITALLASSCEEGAKPTGTPAVPPPGKPEEQKSAASPKTDAKPESAPPAKATPQPEEKKAPDPVKPAQPSTPPAAASTAASPALLSPALATEKAPDKFKAKLTTTKGDFVVEVTRDWAPQGADRFYNLVKIGYLTDVAFFRNIQGFMVQFGINGSPAVNEKWRSANIPDDPVKQSNQKGFITFATAGPNTRTTQLFINFANNANLDRMGFSPFGQVVEGMNVVESLYNGYGEGAPRGRGPQQDLAQKQGNAYLKKDFPELDYVKSAAIVP
jgi:peptidyl-prolyl cis-trans isomerase A (cyclophilin A)